MTNPDTILAIKLFAEITNPKLSEDQKRTMAKQNLHALHMVASRFGVTPTEVYEAYLRKDARSPVILFKEDETETDEDTKLFWAYIDECEAHYLEMWK